MDKKRKLPLVNHADRAEPGVGRRRVLQGLFAGAGAGMAIPGLAADHPMQHHAMSSAPTEAQAKAKAADWKPEFLDEHQFATLTALCARIVPGSDKALADRHVDSLLAVDTREHKRRFLSAMGALDAGSRDKFGKPFRALTEAQQNDVLTLASTAESGEKYWVWTPGTPVERPDFGPEVVTLRDHFDHVKGWIVGAYYSSEAGLKELGYTGQMFFTTFPDCTHKEHT
jgi:Gluconate 2-dehydrogenase subunit 3